MVLENKWTWGNVTQLVALVTTIVGLGIAIGTFNTKLEALEVSAVQSAADSRTLIEVKQDVAYIKDAVKQFQSIASAALPVSCPMEQPVRVAAYCRTLPVVQD